MLAIGYEDVVEAARRLDGYAVRTPLLENALLNERVGGRVLIKPEVLQRSGSFKFRGAFNRISQLTPEEREGGVVAWSSGNHAQGVAAAAALLGIRAAIVMPSDAPKLKIENTRSYGADVILYDRWTENREAIAKGIADERGSATVPPYDHPQVMAGQGTVGLEIIEQTRALGVAPDDVLAPCSGGGLVSGIATAVRHVFPDTRVWSVEPDGFNDAARSLAAGERVSNEGGRTSLCDALMAPTPGTLTFPIMKERLAGGLTVTDEEVKAAMAYAFTVLKLVVEPGGAVTLAAVLSGKLPVAGRTVVVVLSGGNVDPGTFADVLAG